MSNKVHKFGFRVSPHWLRKVSIAARLAETDASEFSRQAVLEKIDRLKMEKPGFAAALASALERQSEKSEPANDYSL